MSVFHWEIGEEPLFPLCAPAIGEGVFFVLAASGEEGGGGIAERFAGVVIEGFG